MLSLEVSKIWWKSLVKCNRVQRTALRLLRAIPTAEKKTIGAVILIPASQVHTTRKNLLQRLLMLP